MAYIENSSGKKPSLFSAITIGVGSIIGSGWLFASYKASKVAGTVALGSWVIGAFIALLVALLLAEVATYYSKETGLFARLLSLTHNPDMGFIISSSNWFCTIIIIPAEAEATIQYLSQAYPAISDYVFTDNHFTALGLFFVCITMLMYGLINYWGIRLFAKANNLITTFKLIVPAATAIIFLSVSYHPENLTSFQGTIAPYGYGKMFTAVVACGIFYSFYGFNTITFFSAELENPQKNIPLALISSILICLIIYLLLQYSFLVALDPVQVATKGWDSFNFDSPLAQLAVLFGMNWMAILLYVDAAVSPSGTGIIFVGSSARIFTGMAQDGQMPKIFGKIHPLHGVSRLSIVTTLAFCMALVIFFDNWDKIMIVVSVFMAISCIAVPVAFVKLRKMDPAKRPFTMPAGLTVSYISYIAITYLLTQCGFLAAIVSLGFHVALFLIYCVVYYGNLKMSFRALLSSWSMFAYLILACALSYATDSTLVGELEHFIILVVLATINYYFMINQKNYQLSK
ncbi:MAG: APC family permease [Burkholderiales bacterium]|nr:APC family permease [Burkholderiales bacterium]